jgi:hypothetical protein
VNKKRKQRLLPTPEQVEAAVDSLWSFWKACRESLRHVERLPPEQKSRGAREKLLQKEAARTGLRFTTTMRKAMHVAAYEENDIRKLCREVRQCKARFGASHLALVVGLPERRRRALTRVAIKKRWSTRQLVAESQRQWGRRPGVGQHPEVPKQAPRRLLLMLQSQTLKYQRWLNAVPAGSLPPAARAGVGARIRGVLRAVDALADELARHVRTWRPHRETQGRVAADHEEKTQGRLRDAGKATQARPR